MFTATITKDQGTGARGPGWRMNLGTFEGLRRNCIPPEKRFLDHSPIIDGFVSALGITVDSSGRCTFARVGEKGKGVLATELIFGIHDGQTTIFVEARGEGQTEEETITGALSLAFSDVNPDGLKIELAVSESEQGNYLIKLSISNDTRQLAAPSRVGDNPTPPSTW